MIKRLLGYALCLFMLTACIENDIPYPIIEAQILSFEVEGQRSAPGSQKVDAEINNKERQVTVYVNDTVDLSQLKVTKFITTEGTKVIAEGHPNFPQESFVSTPTGNPYVDFRQSRAFTLSIYQDYPWTITVHQVVDREISVENQVGDAVVDVANHKVVVYVSKKQKLNHIEVNVMNLGGESGTVVPEPTQVTDFSSPVTFQVCTGWSDVPEEWTVYVYQTAEQVETKVQAFPMATSVVLTGNLGSGKTPIIQYRKAKTKIWWPISNLEISGSEFSTVVSGLKPNTEYEYRVNVDGKEGTPVSFRTAEAIPLENGTFDLWHLEKGKIWNPWSEATSSFWDTGNDGACTVGKSNSVPTADDTANKEGKAAYLETIDMFGYLAAGNLFTGEYLRTEVPNGVLNFGRPFTSFPTKLRINYKYLSTVITKAKAPYEALKGQPDSCAIYIALTNWDKPLEIRTDPKNRQLFDKSAPEVIAYAEMVQGTSDEGWQTKDLVLEYRRYEKPTHILIVATASKYGDFFTGGPGSTLLVDNFELIYD